MKKLVYLSTFLGMSLFVAGLAYGHGGSYRPPGAGQGGGFSPGGVGSPGPGPGPSGTGTGGQTGAPGGAGVPVGPGGGAGSPTGNGGVGSPGGVPGGSAGALGAATGISKKGPSDFNTTWSAWWFVNDDRFLNLKARIRAEEAETINTDLFHGEQVDVDRNKLTAKKIREGVLPALRLALKDSYYDTRAAAAIALGKCGYDQDLFKLQSILNDRDKRVRESAALGIGILGNKAGIPILISIMNDDAAARQSLRKGGQVLPRTRAFAAIGIGLIGQRSDVSDTSAVEALLAFVQDERATKAHVDLAVAPMLALGLMKAKEAVPVLIKYMENAHHRPVTRSYAANTLGKIGSRLAVPSLVKALKNKEASVAQSAAIALGQILDEKDTKAVRSLQKIASSAADKATRNLALMSLAQIGGQSNLDFIARRLLKGNTEERPFAALAAGVYCYNNPGDREYRAFMAKKVFAAFRSPRSPDAQGAYAVSMGLMKYDDAGAAMLKALNTRGQASLRQNIAMGLGLMDYREAIPAVRAIVAEKGDVALRRDASIALGLLGDRDAMQFLTSEMQRSSNTLPVLGAVTQGLGFIGDASVVSVLTDMVRDSKKHKDAVRAFSAVALGLLGDKDALPFGSQVSENINYIQRTDAIREILTIL